MASRKFNATRFLKTTAAASAVAAFPYIRTSHAAGKLEVGFWDHWVPGANNTLTSLCNEWAAKEKVEIKIDYIPSQGQKNLLTIAAEAQAKSGHDMLAMPIWQTADKGKLLEPLDAEMKALTAKNGDVSPLVAYLGKSDGHWVAIPATPGSQIKGPCGRIDLFKQHAGIDLQKMYPAGAPPDKALADAWTWDAFLAAAEKCHKAGFPFGIGLGGTCRLGRHDGRAVRCVRGPAGRRQGQHHGQVRRGQAGARVHEEARALPAAGRIRLGRRLQQQIAGGGQGLADHEPAQRLGGGQARQRQGGRAVVDLPGAARAQKGRHQPYTPYFWSIWKFSKNKAAAKSLLLYLSERSSVEKMVAASQGYDIPSFSKLHDFKTWTEEGPPKGTLYNYPPTPDLQLSVAAYPAPPKIGVQIYTQAISTKMVAKCTQGGESIDKAIAWAASELQGFMRS